jgi:peptide/nickel transport system ATP-binding protein
LGRGVGRVPGSHECAEPGTYRGEQIREPILLHEKVGQGAAAKRTADLLDSVGVPALREKSYSHELSGGQRQRVMIAMAMACRPDLIIADEPTTALDVIVQAQILTLLSDLVRDPRISLVMISHDLSVLAEFCERLAVMYAGRVVEIGPSRELIQAPRHPYTRALAQAFPRLGDMSSRLAPSGLAGDPPDLRTIPPGCPFNALPEVLQICATTDVELWPAGSGRRSACVRVLPSVPAGATDVHVAGTSLPMTANL